MKKLYLFLSGLMIQACCLAANPGFYVLYIDADNNAMLHTTQEKIDRGQRLALTVLESKQATCCFVFGAQAKNKGGRMALKVNNDQPLLSSSIGEETYQFLGAFRPAVTEKADNRLAFGMVGMSGARLVGNRTYEVKFSDATPPVYLRHCLGLEGVNFKLYRSLNDKKPFISYYYALGYDVEANCPA